MICIDGQPLLCFCPVILAIAIGSEFRFLIWFYICISVLWTVSIPLFWINLSFVPIFSTINPPLMTYCIPDTKQRRYYQHRHHKCHRYTSVIVIITIVMMRRRCIEIGQPRAYLALPGASASRLFTNCDSFDTCTFQMNCNTPVELSPMLLVCSGVSAPFRCCTNANQGQHCTAFKRNAPTLKCSSLLAPRGVHPPIAVTTVLNIRRRRRMEGGS